MEAVCRSSWPSLIGLTLVDETGLHLLNMGI